MSKIAKAIVAGLMALATWGTSVSVDGHVSMSELFGLIGVAVAFFAVYQVPNSKK